MKLLIIFFTIVTFVGCGSKMKRTSQSGRNADNRGLGGDGTAKRCQMGSVTNEEKDQGFAVIDVNNKFLYSPDGVAKSLCDYIKDTDSKIAIFQFAGVTCLSCQVEAEDITQKMILTTKYPDVSHIVALTDYREDYDEAMYGEFMKSYAPFSIRAHDSNIALWKYFSVNPNRPTRPTIAAIADNGLAYVINQEGDDPMRILDVVEAMVEKKSLDSKPTIPGNNNEQPDIGNGDDGNDDDDGDDDGDNDDDGDDDGQKPLSLSTAQNQSIVNFEGKTKKITDIFDTDFLVIDLSQYYCTYCHQLARSHESSTSYQKLMSGSKCKSITVVPNRDLANWHGDYPGNTFVGKNSYGGSTFGFADAFGINFTGTPTVLVVNRAGKVVAQEVGGVPSEVQNLCKP